MKIEKAARKEQEKEYTFDLLSDEENEMRENIFQKLTPGADYLPKKFLPITETEW